MTTDASETRSVLHAAAAFCARWLLIAAAVAVVVWLATQVLLLVLPLAVALLLAALLSPLVGWMRRRGVPASLATALTLVGGLAAVAAVLVFVVAAFVANLGVLSEQLLASVQALRDWAVQGPLGLAPEQLAGLQQQATAWLATNQQWLTRQAATTTSAVGTFLTGLLLTVFALVFFLYDGTRLWRATCRIAPAGERARILEAGRRAFGSLAGFMRATTVVAAVDAAGVGIALLLLGVPLAGPITALVFLGGFVPVVGAIVSGVVAVAITAVTQGLVPALIMTVVVVAVQQLEGNVLQPWLLGDAVRLHPMAIVFGVTGGATIAGVAGAVLAVPVITTVHTAVLTWTQPQPRESADRESAEPDTAPTSE